MAFVNFLSNFTNGLFRHFVCFENFHSPVSELIHLARCVKFSPYFIPGIVLILFCGTQSNRRTNFIPRLAGFNPRLALIVFSGTGARCMRWSVEVCWFPRNSLVNLLLMKVRRESWQKVETRKTKLITSVSAVN